MTWTKWQVLEHRRNELLDQAHDLLRQMEGMQATTFGRPCTGCDTVLETEADFAKHFIVPDLRFLNLGYCPDEGNVTNRPRVFAPDWVPLPKVGG